MKKRQKKSVYDPFLNKKISIEDEPYKKYSKKISKTEKTSKQPSAEKNVGIFEGIKNAFFSDIVWLSISISLLLATFLFYFQVLQPRILTNIATRAQNQILQVQTSFSDQLKDYNDLQRNIISRNTIGLNEACNEDQLYRDSQSDTSFINSLEKKLAPDVDLETLDYYSIFTLDEIQEEYNNYYEFYKYSVDEIKSESQKLNEFINYKNYENEWIKNCIQLSESINIVNDLTEICESQKIEVSNDKFPTLFSQLKTIEDQEKEICNELNQNQNTFSFTPISSSSLKLDWLSLMGEITVIDSQLVNLFDESNKNVDTNKYQQETQKSINRIDEIVNSKKGVKNIWYILDFNLMNE